MALGPVVPTWGGGSVRRGRNAFDSLPSQPDEYQVNVTWNGKAIGCVTVGYMDGRWQWVGTSSESALFDSVERARTLLAETLGSSPSVKVVTTSCDVAVGLSPSGGEGIVFLSEPLNDLASDSRRGRILKEATVFRVYTGEDAQRYWKALF